MAPSISLMPHSVCWAAAPRLIWTMVITNLITFLSYCTICSTLLFLVGRTRRVIARDWYFFVVGFALFIVACGSTHLLEVATTWIPIFWVDAWTNIVTAVLSATVALLLIRRAAIIGFSINDYAARLGNAEKEKQQMESSLLSAQKLEDWSRMSAVVSHEIANPLEAVQNLLHLIRTSEGVSTEVASLAEVASEETSRVAALSRSTLSFFRHTSEPEPIDLAAAIESVRFLLMPTLTRRHLTLDTCSTGEVTVEAFPGEIRQVLLNLIRNACEASQENSEVRVNLQAQPDGVEIVIADRGTGITPGVLADLFRFGQSTKGAQGNGMGLWTVKQILDKHHGTIGVQSTMGEGTSFTLWWPRRFAVRGAELSLAGNTA